MKTIEIIPLACREGSLGVSVYEFEQPGKRPLFIRQDFMKS